MSSLAKLLLRLQRSPKVSILKIRLKNQHGASIGKETIDFTNYPIFWGPIARFFARAYTICSQLKIRDFQCSTCWLLTNLLFSKKGMQTKSLKASATEWHSADFSLLKCYGANVCLEYLLANFGDQSVNFGDYPVGALIFYPHPQYASIS